MKWPPAVLKSGGVAVGGGVDVDGVLADGEVLELDLDLHALLDLLEGDGAGVLSGAGLEVGPVGWGGGEGDGWEGDEAKG